MTQRCRVGVLISGRGSNLEALLQASLKPDYPAEIACVISSKREALGLLVAEKYGIPHEVLEKKAFLDVAAYENAMADLLLQAACQWVFCAGYMRILTSVFLKRFPDRVVNIHPSLLPSYKGLHTHRRALEDGVLIHGCSVHHVCEELDSGALIAQAAVPVLFGDTEESLAARVLRAEHQIYPKALAWLASGMVRIEGGKVFCSVKQEEGAFLYAPHFL